MGSKINELTPLHCYEIPKDLAEAVLYISKEYGVAIHLCACGCGGKTVTPLGSGNWSLIENGEKVTMRPSIGNWSGESPYHAHYYITENRIEWI